MNSRILFLPVIGATTFFILLFTFTKLFGPIPFSVTSVTTQKSDTFQVSGEGKVSVPPDVAIISVGVQSQASTVKVAQEQLNSNINKVSEAIKKLGVDQKDIQTTNYSISPNYDYRVTPQKITEYNASSNLSIKVRQIDKSNDVIDTATASGANQVGGISFEVDDKEKWENEAREKAVADAKKKAQQASKIAGFRLGRIINYSENFADGFPRPYAVGAVSLESKEASTQVEPGSSEITVTVTLSYEIQ